MAALLQVHASLSVVSQKASSDSDSGSGSEKKVMDSDSEDEKPRPALSGSESQSGSKSESDSDPPPRKGPQSRKNGLTSFELFYESVILLKILLHVGQYFSLLNHREAGAKASCTETKASPGKASTFVFVRQRQVKLLSELLPSRHTDQFPLWILRLMCKRDRCVPPKW